MKLLLDSLEILKNVSMIEFKIIKDHGSWLVVKKLGTSVEIGGIVLICFNNEKIRVR